MGDPSRQATQRLEAGCGLELALQLGPTFGVLAPLAFQRPLDPCLLGPPQLGGVAHDRHHRVGSAAGHPDVELHRSGGKLQLEVEVLGHALAQRPTDRCGHEGRGPRRHHLVDRPADQLLRRREQLRHLRGAHVQEGAVVAELEEHVRKRVEHGAQVGAVTIVSPALVDLLGHVGDHRDRPDVGAGGSDGPGAHLGPDGVALAMAELERVGLGHPLLASFDVRLGDGQTVAVHELEDRPTEHLVGRDAQHLRHRFAREGGAALLVDDPDAVGDQLDDLAVQLAAVGEHLLEAQLAGPVTDAEHDHARWVVQAVRDDLDRSPPAVAVDRPTPQRLAPTPGRDRLGQRRERQRADPPGGSGR